MHVYTRSMYPFTPTFLHVAVFCCHVIAVQNRQTVAETNKATLPIFGADEYTIIGTRDITSGKLDLRGVLTGNDENTENSGTDVYQTEGAVETSDSATVYTHIASFVIDRYLYAQPVPDDITSRIPSTYKCYAHTVPDDIITSLTAEYQRNIKILTDDANTSLVTYHQSHAQLSADDVIKCLKSRSHIHLIVETGRIEMDLSANILDLFVVPKQCYISVAVPSGNIIRFDSERFEWLWHRATFIVIDGEDLHSKELAAIACTDFGIVFRNVFSFSNFVLIKISVGILLDSLVLMIENKINVHLRLEAVDETVRPRMEVKYLSPKRGYVHSPFYGNSLAFMANLDEWVDIRFSQIKAVMISLEQVSLETDDSISLYGSYHPHEKIQPEMQVLHNMSFLRCNFKTGIFKRRVSGFKMLFSLHDEHEIPEKLPSGLWNCSVSHFVNFLHHLWCNLKRECENGEDERGCPYTSAACGGNIAYGKSCYTYNIADNSLSWFDARDVCEKSGGHLATLNSFAEWQAVNKALDYRRSYNFFYIGLTGSSLGFPSYYQGLLQWTDRTVAYYYNFRPSSLVVRGVCTSVSKRQTDSDMTAFYIDCNEALNKEFVCEHDVKTGDFNSEENGLPKFTSLGVNVSSVWSGRDRYVECPEGHKTHDFLSCDVQSACFANSYTVICGSPIAQVPAFRCDNHFETVPYTLVCNFVKDCTDGSDESFCVYSECAPYERKCKNGKCVHYTAFCDNVNDCFDLTDEKDCEGRNIKAKAVRSPVPLPPVIILQNSNGRLMTHKMATQDTCPDSHFLCTSDAYCLPVYLRCNGVYDCPDHEDESGCGRYTCPGFYRCRASRVCLHVSHVCDGVFQCPLYDDEILCQLTCPENCTCLGLAFTCAGQFQYTGHSEVRYLDLNTNCHVLENIKMGLKDSMLIYLSLQNCHLTNINLAVLLSNAKFYNLRILDLSENDLLYFTSILDTLSLTSNLRVLKLSGNPLMLDTITSSTRKDQLSLVSIDLSRVMIPEIISSHLKGMSGLKELNLSQTELSIIHSGFLTNFASLTVLDLRHNPLNTVPLDELKHMTSLQALWSHDFKLCCPGISPNSLASLNCFGPTNEISSCTHLLKSSLFRALLWVIATLALFGNGVSFCIHLKCGREFLSAPSVFIITSFLAQFLIGICLVIVGVADLLFQGHYALYDNQWKQSAVCRVVRFVFLTVSQVLAFNIAILTLNNILCFADNSFLSKRNPTLLSCAVLWAISVGLAAPSLAKTASNWELYRMAGVCIPIPLAMATLNIHAPSVVTSSVVIILILNFVLFLLVILGQTAVFITVCYVERATTRPQTPERVSYQNLTSIILFTAGSYLMTSCSFYFILSGRLSSNDINIGLSFFLIPLNSAINPILYILKVQQLRRKRAEEKRLAVLLQRQMKL